MAKAVKQEVIERASKEVQDKFDLSRFKTKKGFGVENAKFKPQSWIPLSKAFQDVTGLPGIPMGQITLLRGHSDVGKSTCLIDCAVHAQQMGVLPVFIITEEKWNWQFCKNMGLQISDVVDKNTGEIIGHDGFFLFVDRETLKSIEDVGAYIMDLIDEQRKGNLPYDLCFLWDSIGSIPCQMSLEAKKVHAIWDAGAMSQTFGRLVGNAIVMSRKESYPYQNTLCATNQIWVSPPETPMSSPKVNGRGGETMYYLAGLSILFGNIANSGVTKLKAVSGGKEFEWGKRSSIQVEKNHIGGVTSKGKIVMTPTGFIPIEPKEVEKYKESHKQEWCTYLGSDNFELVEEAETVDSGLYIPPEAGD